MIALQLPLPDAANFALINRRLSMLLGPTYWPRLRTDAVIPGHREQFLNTFARDLPSWFFCQLCSQLHPVDRVDSPGPFDQPSNLLRCEEAGLGGLLDPHPVGSSHSYWILFHHLQLVMRRHYLGPGYGISTNDLSFVQVNEVGQSELMERTKTLFSVEARVCTEPARLCLHIQSWTVLHTNVLEVAVERAKCVGVCIHQDAEEGEMFQLIVSSLEEYLTGLEGPREPKRRICRRCQLLYQLEVLTAGNDGLAIVITKWLDLGSGLTPLDPKWRFLSEYAPRADGIDHAGDAERCRLDFEKEEGLKHHGITLRNASYLSKKQFRKTMNETYTGVWVLQAGRRRIIYGWPAILFLLLLTGWTVYGAVMRGDRLAGLPQALIIRRM